MTHILRGQLTPVCIRAAWYCWYTAKLVNSYRVAPAYLNAWQFLVAVTECAKVEVIVDKSWSGDGYAHSKMPSTSVLLVANGYVSLFSSAFIFLLFWSTLFSVSVIFLQEHSVTFTVKQKRSILYWILPSLSVWVCICQCTLRENERCDLRPGWMVKWFLELFWCMNLTIGLTWNEHLLWSLWSLVLEGCNSQYTG